MDWDIWIYMVYCIALDMNTRNGLDMSQCDTKYMIQSKYYLVDYKSLNHL